MSTLPLHVILNLKRIILTIQKDIMLIYYFSEMLTESGKKEVDYTPRL